MWHPAARPRRTAASTAARFSTGNVPGIPRHTGSVEVLGSAPNAADDHEKIFDRVERWVWISRPMTTSYLPAPALTTSLLPRDPGEGARATRCAPGKRRRYGNR